MSVMSTEVIPGGWRYADLEQLPDDGHRYEIIDGTLLVNASPAPRHQLVLARLYSLVEAAAPSGHLVLFAPLDVVLADDTVVEPDLLVAPREAFGEKFLPGPPLLAVEVLSPSTRSIDLTMKRERYQRAAIPSYWLVDPADPVRVTVLELRDGAYVEVADVRGDESFTVTLPFAVTLVPSALSY